jgi:hypothetical protein
MRRVLPTFIAALSLCLCAAPRNAAAAPGPADGVDGPQVTKGELTVHLGFARLLTRRSDADDVVNTEIGYDFSNRFRLTASSDIGSVSHSPFVASSKVEALYDIGRIAGVQTAFRIGYHHAWRERDDGVEASALLTKIQGPFEGRLNLIAEQGLTGPRDADLGYAILAVLRTTEHLQLGVKALGGLASTQGFGGKAEYLGPSAVVTVPVPRAGGQIRIEAAYLAARGVPRDDPTGLWSVVAQWERVF